MFPHIFHVFGVASTHVPARFLHILVWHLRMFPHNYFYAGVAYTYVPAHFLFLLVWHLRMFSHVFIFWCGIYALSMLPHILSFTICGVTSTVFEDRTWTLTSNIAVRFVKFFISQARYLKKYILSNIPPLWVFTLKLLGFSVYVALKKVGHIQFITLCLSHLNSWYCQGMVPR